jgi:hypothetical protein
MHWIATLSRAVLPTANTPNARGEAAIQKLIDLLRWIAAPLILCLGLTSAALAQARFEAVGPEYDVAAVPGLRIVTIRDNALSTCYTVFMMGSGRQAQGAVRAPSLSLEEAAALRDRRLAELSAAYQRGQGTFYPGFPTTDPLAYNWEAQKVQNAFALAVLDHEFARLEDQLQQLTNGGPQMLAVDTVPCPVAGSARPSPGPARPPANGFAKPR